MGHRATFQVDRMRLRALKQRSLGCGIGHNLRACQHGLAGDPAECRPQFQIRTQPLIVRQHVQSDNDRPRPQCRIQSASQAEADQRRSALRDQPACRRLGARWSTAAGLDQPAGPSGDARFRGQPDDKTEGQNPTSTRRRLLRMRPR